MPSLLIALLAGVLVYLILAALGLPVLIAAIAALIVFLALVRPYSWRI